MPKLCRIKGMIVKMLFFDNQQHNEPHVHVYVAEHSAAVGLDGNMLAGSLPIKSFKVLREWMTLHKTELSAAWNNAVIGNQFEEIKPVGKEGEHVHQR